jgi:anthranilate synthase/aminodeoxychorismate synthase-like glutamine amidotransferase
MILLIDNYDSFVYNLARYFTVLGHAVVVKRHDAISLDEIRDMNPSHLIISPGPCTPNEAGISLEAIRIFSPILPILGVCLGHQAIGQVYGAKIVRALYPMHGKASDIHHTGTDLFHDLPDPLRVGRYHSLVIDPKTCHGPLEITAYSAEGEIMAVRHREYPTYGVQFHPESVLTVGGPAILANFLKSRPNHRSRPL